MLLLLRSNIPTMWMSKTKQKKYRKETKRNELEREKKRAEHVWSYLTSDKVIVRGYQWSGLIYMRLRAPRYHNGVVDRSHIAHRLSHHLIGFGLWSHSHQSASLKFFLFFFSFFINSWSRRRFHFSSSSSSLDFISVIYLPFWNVVILFTHIHARSKNEKKKINKLNGQCSCCCCCFMLLPNCVNY